MPTDHDLFILRHTEFADVVNTSEACKTIAHRYNLNINNVRWAVYRGNTIENRLKLNNLLSQPSQIDPSVVQQKEIIQESQHIFNLQQDKLAHLDRPSVGIFLSDTHFPHHHHKALELAVNIIDDLPYVDYISVENDCVDLKNWSLKFADNRAARDKLFDEDVAYLNKLVKNFYETLHLAAPKAHLIQVMGNHDRRRYEFYRNKLPQACEQHIAEYMTWLSDLDVLQFTRGFHENSIQLSPSLVWCHGRWASKLHSSNARNALKQFTRNGMASNVVQGHTHRSGIVDGSQIGMNGVSFVNSGCLCQTEGVEYLNYGCAPEWKHGITICYFNPSNRKVRFDLVNFSEDMTAVVNGVEYE